MIKSFRDKNTEQFWNTGKSKGMPPATLRRTAARKLSQLDAAAKLEDLRIPPGNRLEKLERDRAGQHSISINKQFRICFVWIEGDAHDVEIVDYH
jgi:toxin HigB-1